MSTGGPGGGGPPITEYMTRPRRIHMMIDLNVPPPENRDREGASTHVNSSNAPIDVDASDDEVVVMSPRTFAETGSTARRNRANTVAIDVDSEERAATEVINLEGSAYEMWQRQNIQLHRIPTPPPPPPPPPPAEPLIPCPVCMGPLVEETSTKCGHIFCKKCIMSAIAAQGKCPTCRKKVAAKNLIRIYLPISDE